MKTPFLFFVLFVLVQACGVALGQAADAKVRVLVVDRENSAYAGLKAEDIRVAAGKVPVRVGSLTRFEDVPLNVLIVVDASMSQEKSLPNERRVAEYLIDNILKAGRDSVGIVKFTDTVDVLQPVGGDLAAAKARIAEIKFEPPPGYAGPGVLVVSPPAVSNTGRGPGSTSLFDTVRTGVELLGRSGGQGKRNVVLLITDGVNTSGDSKKGQAVEAALAAGTSVFAIGMGDPPTVTVFGDPAYMGVDRGTLKKLTEPTGGTYFVPNRKLTDLTDVMKKLADCMRSGYEITLTSFTKGSDAEASIEIVNPRLKSAGVRVIYPKVLPR